MTSLVGIGCAIVYSGVHHWLMNYFQGNVDALASKLDEIFPRRSAEDWLTDIKSESQNQTTALKNIGGQVATENSWLEKSYTESQQQTTHLQNIDTDISSQKAIMQNIGEDVARAIYEGLDERMNDAIEKFCDKLEEKIFPQTDRICALIEELNKSIEKLGAGGTDTLGKVISNGVGAQMERFSNALDKFSDSIDEKLKNAEKFSKDMNEQLLATLKDLNEALRQQAEASAAERTAEYKKFTDTLESLIGTLQGVADKIKVQQTDAAKDFETLLKNALDNFNAVVAKMLEDAKKERDADDDKRKADAKLNQDTNEQFLATLAGLSKTLQDVSEKIKDQQEGTLGNFELLIEILIERLENLAKTNAAQISEAVKAFNEIINRHKETTKNMFAQVQNHLNETNKFLQQVNDAGISLKQAAEPVKQSTAQLTKNLLATSAQMNTLATANQTTRQNLSELSSKLNDFVDKFDGIADELEKSTGVIKNSLENYNAKTNAGLKEKLEAFDKSMGDAASYLRSSVEDLSDTLADFNRKRG